MAKIIRGRVFSVAAVSFLTPMLWAQGNTATKTNSGKATATQATGADPRTRLMAAVCNIDAAGKTVRVLPWDGKTWKRDSLKVLAWNDQTRLTSGTRTLTMPQFIAGKPLDDDSKDLAGIEGERAVFYIQAIGGKEVVTKVEMMALFSGESLPAMVGNSGVQIAGGTKVSCGTGTASRGQEPHGRDENIAAKGDRNRRTSPEPADLRLTVITTDGATHMLVSANLSIQHDLNLSSWGFSPSGNPISCCTHRRRGAKGTTGVYSQGNTRIRQADLSRRDPAVERHRPHNGNGDNNPLS